jgi:hypothetical protein
VTSVSVGRVKGIKKSGLFSIGRHVIFTNIHSLVLHPALVFPYFTVQLEVLEELYALSLLLAHG